MAKSEIRAPAEVPAFLAPPEKRWIFGIERFDGQPLDSTDMISRSILARSDLENVTRFQSRQGIAQLLRAAHDDLICENAC
jgi:hypothetical protein